VVKASRAEAAASVERQSPGSATVVAIGACASSGSSRNVCSPCARRTGTGSEASCSRRWTDRRGWSAATASVAEAPRQGRMIPMEPGSLVTERKMLRGIKELAERLATGAV